MCEIGLHLATYEVISHILGMRINPTLDTV